MTSPRTEEVPQHDNASSFGESASAGSTPVTDPFAASASGADRVTVVEVGPRDGLQNEHLPIPTSAKIAFVDALSLSGLPVIEVTSFVNPRAVPQLADASEVMLGITRAPGVIYPALVPNERGLQRAVDAGVQAIALFSAATEEFAHANVGTSIAGTFERFLPVVASARERGIWIRGYVSVAFGCPYAGEVDPAAAANVAEKFLALGCDEICLADTIGVATPSSVRSAVSAAFAAIPVGRLALHFHDTNGLALDNVVAGLDLGVRIFDAAAGGLGGCPFAPGAPGNVATQSLLDRLHDLGLQTGIDRNQIQFAVELIRPFVPRLQTALA